MRQQSVITVLAFLFVFLFFSCQEDSPMVYDEGSNEYVNQWMYKQMKKYYYWNSTMPGQGNLSLQPTEYFKYLLDAGDRFSYAISPGVPESFPKSLRSSFGFNISFTEYQGQVYGVITYVLSNSPAYNSGLKRGDLIKSVNGSVLSFGNYEALYKGASDLSNIQLGLVKYSEESGFSAEQQFTISQGLIFLEPVRHTIISQPGHKIGYIEIPHFDIGLSLPLQQAFEDFKAASVTDVVVDLRYNGGGDISSAAALCILLAPSISPDEQFIRFKGNANGGEIEQTFTQALEMNEFNITFEVLRNARPSIGKVYILCGSHTASASEIIINNLKPYMEVITIGEKTVGKDYAGFPIEDERATVEVSSKWILYPVIYRLSNANGEGNYSTGIQPLIPSDELGQLMIYPLGDTREILLKRALSIISGNGRNSEKDNCTKSPLNQPAVRDNTPLLINDFFGVASN